MTTIEDSFQRLSERYASGDLPWDQQEPPPEVIELGLTLEPGRALDVGCGYGRAAIYLAGHGWTVDAVDFVDRAVAETRRRVEEAGLGDLVRVNQATVPDLDFLSGDYDLVLDVGCGHCLGQEDLPAYRDVLVRLMRPGGLLAWFTRLRAVGEPVPESGPPGLEEVTIRQVFDGPFTLERVAYGEGGGTTGPAWPAAWLWFRRAANPS